MHARGSPHRSHNTSVRRVARTHARMCIFDGPRPISRGRRASFALLLLQVAGHKRQQVLGKCLL
uniref:Uncharacterized protein n=1 Tax=Oryza sativa subsp. japonica TaxID=39947 RepID=Q6YVW5_ORYSJ|nr:hypothetical protein [Oryza sativa Japonica Group]BAC84482.1 hypothetical protein [Oryza sativa Japonica Group]